MSIRIKIVLVIASIIAAITISSTGIGLFFTKGWILETIGKDMVVVSEIADQLVSSELRIIKATLTMVADQPVSDISLSQALEMLRTHTKGHYYLALTFFRADGTFISSGTAAPTTVEFLESKYAQRALKGAVAISTTEKTAEGSLVFRVYLPAGEGVLVATVSSLRLADTIMRFQIGKTGSIFILDEDGTFIAFRDQDAVYNRQNFIEQAQKDPSYQSAAEFHRLMTERASGVSKYTLYGVERVCAYRPISDLTVNWSIGVSSPIAESPVAEAWRGLLFTAAIFLGLGGLAAIFVAGQIARQFEKIEEQNIRLAELMETAQEASNAKSNFLASMSHEMRTPLNAIIGLSELALGFEEVRGEAAEYLRKIYSSGATLLGIINDILDISKTEAGKFELAPVLYNIPSLINDTVTLNIIRIGDKPIQFRLHIDGTMPSKLFGDELRVKQIFNNLLSNAFKYTKEGFVDWFVSCERDGGYVWLVTSVKDTGVGMCQEDLGKLFSDYSQLNTKRDRNIEGTGLGLAITKKMAELMDGSITVESEYGKGSTFTVRLRQKFVSDVPIGEEVAENLKQFHYSDEKRDFCANLVRIRLPYARVLIVDDVQTNLDVAKGMMKPYGMQVDCATSASQAIELIRKAEVKYSAVFMDHMMPGMDGIEATRVIRREIGSDYAHSVPIIALTANAILGSEEKFLSHGFQAFLSKPIDVRRMDQIIRQWVRDEALESKIECEPEAQGGEEPGKFSESRFEKWKIEGLDLKKGLARFWNVEESFLDVLHSYIVNTRPLLDKSRHYARVENLPEYATVVHGVKSSSYGIYANMVGEKAEALERAAREGDAAFVLSNNDSFIELAEKLIEDLVAMMSEIAPTSQKLRKPKPDAALLVRLEEACANFSMDAVDEVMEEIESYEYESQTELIVWLRERVNLMEFDRIRERLELAAK
ncbi:hypothetical protein AGMMS49957_14730 [Synergistales bacterium]|nr:hypothetical protein AGMMS49957_14730 [Synergistales bacterium]